MITPSEEMVRFLTTATDDEFNAFRCSDLSRFKAAGLITDPILLPQVRSRVREYAARLEASA